MPFEVKSYTPLRTHAATAGAKNALNNIGGIFKETVLDMQRFAGVFLDKEFNVKHAVGEFKSFFRFPDGSFNLSVLKLVSPELAVPLGIYLRKALTNDEKVAMSNVKEGSEERYINIVVKPWLQPKEYLQPFLFVVLEQTRVEKKPAAEVVVSASVWPSPGKSWRTTAVNSLRKGSWERGRSF